MTKVVQRFEDATLENYICETQAQRDLVDALKSCVEKGFSENIIITGGVGTGKTHLAYAILNAMAEKRECDGYRWYDDNRVAYTTIKQVVDEIKASWNTASENPTDRLSAAPLLLIDEVGMQYGSASERIELYELFNRRYDAMLPTIALSNNRPAELQRLLGQRIWDRLSGGAIIFELVGRSKRQNGCHQIKPETGSVGVSSHTQHGW